MMLLFLTLAVEMELFCWKWCEKLNILFYMYECIDLSSKSYLNVLIMFYVVVWYFLEYFFSLKAKHGYRNLTGIDYSAASVELARNILQAEDLTDVTVKVRLVIFIPRP